MIYVPWKEGWAVETSDGIGMVLGLTERQAKAVIRRALAYLRDNPALGEDSAIELAARFYGVWR